VAPLESLMKLKICGIGSPAAAIGAAIKKRPGNSRPFCFVDYATRYSAACACALKALEGRPFS
jgi:hypothetical protein